MKARIDSFTEVKKAIQNMTASLEKEQKDEASRRCKVKMLRAHLPVSLTELGSSSGDCMRFWQWAILCTPCKVKQRKYCMDQFERNELAAEVSLRKSCHSATVCIEIYIGNLSLFSGRGRAQGAYGL